MCKVFMTFEFQRFSMKIVLAIFSFLLVFKPGTAQNTRVIPGAERLSVYVPLLKGKRIGVFANNTSMVGSSHLVDTLQKLGVNITTIFGPEHGFRGKASAGEKVGNYVDPKTDVPVISLYGSKHRPSAEDLQNVDIVVFDIQDVGVRFYTYISSLEELMEAVLIAGKPFLILDRPNPNGNYVDGPVLDLKYQSFVGRKQVPIVYGMTIGEYGWMLAREGWLSPEANKRFNYYKNAQNSKDTPFHFLVIKCENYTHASSYDLPERPSPNLPNMASIYWYPSTCLFEGTVLSEGRGTPTPFQVFGHPSYPKNLYAFTPVPNEGAKSSKHYNVTCYGWNLAAPPEKVKKEVNRQIQLKWLIEAYKLFPNKDSFFILPKSGKMEESFFNKLAGNNILWKQIKDQVPEADIRASWKKDLDAFKLVRKRNLLYPDFE